MTAVHELTIEQCERLLRRGIFGRFGVTTPHGPEIVPVTYSVRGDALVVRTSRSGTLARYGDGARLAFEVDDVEDEKRRGWSVVARGRGRLAAIRDNDRTHPGSRVTPGADGDRDCELHLPWDEVTGRQLGSSRDPETALHSRQSLR